MAFNEYIDSYRNMLLNLENNWATIGNELPETRDRIEISFDKSRAEEIYELDNYLFKDLELFGRYAEKLAAEQPPHCHDDKIWYAKLVDISKGEYPFEKIPKYLHDSVKKIYPLDYYREYSDSLDYYERLIKYFHHDWSYDADVLADVRDTVEGIINVSNEEKVKKLDKALFINKYLFIRYATIVEYTLYHYCWGKDIWYANLHMIAKGEYPLEKIPSYLHDSVAEFYASESEKREKYDPLILYKNLLEGFDRDWSADASLLPDIRHCVENNRSDYDEDEIRRLDRSIFTDKKAFLNYLEYLKNGWEPANWKRHDWYYHLAEISEGKYPLDMVPDYLHDLLADFYKSVSEKEMFLFPIQHYKKLIELSFGTLFYDNEDALPAIRDYIEQHKDRYSAKEIESLDRSIFANWRGFHQLAARLESLPNKKDFWYYHLYEISKGEYPFEKIPTHLHSYAERYVDPWSY